MLTLYPAECYDALVSLADADAYWRRMGADDVFPLLAPANKAREILFNMAVVSSHDSETMGTEAPAI